MKIDSITAALSVFTIIATLVWIALLGYVAGMTFLAAVGLAIMLGQVIE